MPVLVPSNCRIAVTHHQRERAIGDNWSRAIEQKRTLPSLVSRLSSGVSPASRPTSLPQS